MSQDQIHVALFAHTEGQTYVHLGAHRALAHRLLGRALGGGNELDGDGAATSGDGVGVPYLAQFFDLRCGVRVSLD
ncbi:hypothetical protein [Nonomuraea africana]|uniref:Uncharacterized protein n=1 Tax=Nonomuraea africana TaxID=46171 RepID=A0ABR9K784_9ACTN|nr:hypothetical protein [Nonomuraea africana]MBE1557867.1 hypothetical protein [Nonomuraea africana]